MRRWVVGLILALAGVAVMVAVATVVLRRAPASSDQATAPRRLGAPPAGESTRLRLLFPGDDSLLHVEAREVPWPEGERERAEVAVSELLAGPQNESLHRVLPPEATLLGVSIEGEVAYLDLGLESQAALPSSGSRFELLAVYALVNTVVVNVDGIKRVALLWNGTQQSTFAGHVDTTHPLRPDARLLAEQRGR